MMIVVVVMMIIVVVFYEVINIKYFDGFTCSSGVVSWNQQINLASSSHRPNLETMIIVMTMMRGIRMIGFARVTGHTLVVAI